MEAGRPRRARVRHALPAAGRYARPHLPSSFQALVWGPIVLARDENIDPDYDEPVRVEAGKDRVVRVKRVAPTLASTRLEFEVPTDDGPIRMTDYASVNGWEGAHICTGLPVK